MDQALAAHLAGFKQPQDFPERSPTDTLDIVLRLCGLGSTPPLPPTSPVPSLPAGPQMKIRCHPPPCLNPGGHTRFAPAPHVEPRPHVEFRLKPEHVRSDCPREPNGVSTSGSTEILVSVFHSPHYSSFGGSNFTNMYPPLHSPSPAFKLWDPAESRTVYFRDSAIFLFSPSRSSSSTRLFVFSSFSHPVPSCHLVLNYICSMMEWQSRARRDLGVRLGSLWL